MNERIKEFAHRADFIGKRHNGNEWRWGYIDPELNAKLDKFAELIIRECAQQARDTDLEDVEGGDSAVLRSAKAQILERFGVTE